MEEATRSCARPTNICSKVLYCVFQDMANRILYVVVMAEEMAICCYCCDVWALWIERIRGDGPIRDPGSLWSVEGDASPLPSRQGGADRVGLDYWDAVQIAILRTR